VKASNNLPRNDLAGVRQWRVFPPVIKRLRKVGPCQGGPFNGPILSSSADRDRLPVEEKHVGIDANLTYQFQNWHVNSAGVQRLWRTQKDMQK